MDAKVLAPLDDEYLPELFVRFEIDERDRGECVEGEIDKKSPGKPGRCFLSRGLGEGDNYEERLPQGEEGGVPHPTGFILESGGGAQGVRVLM